MIRPAVSAETCCRPTLVLVQVCGVRFAVPAESILSVAGSRWRPAGSGRIAGVDQPVDLGQVLFGRSCGRKRTLVVQADSGPWGFAIDGIDKRLLADWWTEDLPALLPGWLRAVVVCAMTRLDDAPEPLLVLDLRLVAHHLASLSAGVREELP